MPCGVPESCALAAARDRRAIRFLSRSKPSLLDRIIAVPHLNFGTIVVLLGRMNIQALAGTAANSRSFTPPRLLERIIAVPDLDFGAIVVLLGRMDIQALAGAAANSRSLEPPRLLDRIIAGPHLNFGAIVMLLRRMHVQTLPGAADDDRDQQSKWGCCARKFGAAVDFRSGPAAGTAA